MTNIGDVNTQIPDVFQFLQYFLSVYIFDNMTDNIQGGCLKSYLVKFLRLAA